MNKQEKPVLPPAYSPPANYDSDLADDLPFYSKTQNTL
jgi:hypothetical protein